MLNLFESKFFYSVTVLRFTSVAQSYWMKLFEERDREDNPDSHSAFELGVMLSSEGGDFVANMFLYDIFKLFCICSWLTMFILKLFINVNTHICKHCVYKYISCHLIVLTS